MEKIRTIIIVLLSIALLISVLLGLHIRFSYNFKPQSYKAIKIDVPNYDIKLTKQQAKNLVADLYKVQHFYKEDYLKNGDAGRTNMFCHIVTIHSNLDICKYIFVYAHELTHLKYMCINETFTNYQTFVTLYESGNDVLKYVALVEANKIMNGCQSGTEYDCGYYIVKYLEGKNK